MYWLVKDAKRHDSLVFHCMCILCRALTQTVIDATQIDSGHGGQTKDLDGDEEDGYDEGGFYLSTGTYLQGANTIWVMTVIYPLDWKKKGHIVDDVRR